MATLSKLIITASWAALLFVGFGFAWQYEATPGRAAKAPSDWPAGSSIPIDGRRPTLIMFAHPQCPCTRASLDLLSSIRSGNNAAAVYVVIVQPPGLEGGLDQSPLAAQAKAISGVRVLADNGSEARRFGAATSGEVLLYTKEGQRLFSGGITSARGHVGPSKGAAGISAYLQHGTIPSPAMPVFGCSLLGAASSVNPR